MEEEDVKGHEEEMDEREKEEGLEEKTSLETGPKITVKKGDDVILEYEMLKDLVTIGRRQTNDIVLDDRKVSRQHTQIKREGNVFTVEDMQSTGGTEVNGKKITSQEMFTGDVIKIGDFELHFDSGLKGEEKTVFEEEDKTTLDEDRTVFYEEAVGKLIVMRSENLQGEINLGEEVIIGRGEGVDIQLEDLHASREHSKIALVNKNFVITDLQSSNGTFVNGEKITEQVLQNGDKIQIGDSIFEFQVEKGAKIVSKDIGKKLLKGVGILAVVVFMFVVVLKFVGREKPHPVILSKVWEKQTKDAVHICPAIGDLNNDIFNDILVADTKGFIYALDGRTGGSIWNKPYNVGCPIFSSLVLGDINQKDGKLDVIVGSDKGKVYTIDGGRGSLIWQSSVVKGAIVSSPALADLNSDKVLDVVVGTKDGFVYALDGKQGGEIWHFDAKNEVKASPSLTDIDGDGILDVIISSPGNIYALSGLNGKRLWFFQGSGNSSSTAIGKFNNDEIEDVVVVLSHFSQQVVVLNGKTGAVLWKWEMPLPWRVEKILVPISPALGDFNGDGTLDVICSSSIGHIYAIDGASKGEKYLWDFSIEGEVPSSASLFDFNGDKNLDVVVTSQKGIIYVINGKDGHLLTQFDIQEKSVGPIAIGDVNANKLADLIVGTLAGKILVVESNARCGKNEILWGVLGKNELHTCRAK